MKNFKVTTTMTEEVAFFTSMEEVKEHIETEIKWFNSPDENKNGNGYDETDFIVDEIEY